ncbi:MAG: ribosome small subunit-dependent GTPase A [Bacteroidales bacterium]|nr:ribosome small subunit-dependent GTPase A [Bacteroidales bacterium]
MTLEDLGYNADFEEFRKEQNLHSFGVARVISEHKERYVVKTPENEYDAEIIGSLRFSARESTDFPAVGDWVAISEYDEDKALIHAIFPRNTILQRQSVGKPYEKQIVATNIDYALIVQAVDRDFNLNRIERYLTICNASGVKPIIILSKVDLIEETELKKLTESIQSRIKKISIISLSNISQMGIDSLRESLITGKTYCLLGSSGVGKSSLANNLSGKQLMNTNTLSESTNKGRHVTSHRELFVLENGGILIDNPGMKEVGIADSGEGLETTFETITELSKTCRYKDCSHTTEMGCSVLHALENEEIDKLSYENYMKMQREKEHFESSVADRRKKDKDFGKMVKNFKKDRKKLKY